MHNLFDIIGAGAALLAAVSQVLVGVSTGQPATLPAVRFKLGDKHYQLSGASLAEMP